MITEIGIVAGEVWHFLDKRNGEALLDDMVREIGKPKDTVLMSVGWLAREGHVLLEGEAPNYQVRLRKEK